MSTSDTVKVLLDFAGAATALIAAGFWFASARLPVHTPGSYWGSMNEADLWLQTTRKAAKLNKWAALFAGLSALSIFLAWCVK